MSSYRLIQLKSQVSMIARSLRYHTTGDLHSQMDSLCHLHTARDVSVKTESLPTLCDDPLRLKALCLLAFPEQVMFGHTEACSPAPCVNGVAQEELLVIQETISIRLNP